MSAPTLHPVYTGVARSRLERLKVGRKYGKYDFERFGHLTGSRHYLENGSIGDMKVTCSFLFTKSRWGVLTPAQNPGGVVYLDLGFIDPPGCRLKGATVLLTLDEEDEDLQRHYAADKPPPKPRVPVQIVEYGPQQLHGQISEALKMTTNSFVPNINVGAFGGFGGVGRESKKQELKKSQWKFSSQALPNHLGKPTTLRWDLNENKIDRQSDHSNTFHTAFAFEHDGQPFFMQVEVSGHLESTTSHLRHKVRQKFKRFKFPAEPRNAITMVNFGGRNNAYKTPLDEEVERIPLDMVLQNMKPVPRVPATQTGARPLYQAIAEETVVDEEEASEGLEYQNGQPYCTNLLTGAETAELRSEAMSVISLGQSSVGPTPQTFNTAPPLQSNFNRHSSMGNSNHESQLSATSQFDPVSPAVQEQDTETQQNVASRSKIRYKEVEKFLQEVDLPLVIQFIILWILSFKIKSPPMKSQNSH
ncbi:hypothetical protein SCAR479_00968 [Seiridium cardinale]|uniref:Uncharacterized protein n=1 Tax=Seiridium cardinale TaxID=138064 RepID=A0ABR2Y7B4_9PEZI